MSSENEDGRSLDKGSENSDVSKKLKISYSRELLLSLSNLDSCKKLPSGFVESLSSELEDALIREPDRPRIPGTFHGFRRSEYGMSPPTRGDSGNYSRGIHGKWDSRSSLRSDRDSDSQSDKDSDSGRRFGHQTRWTWQSPEHDGLLGSGSFPRPSGYASGAPAPKFRANDHSQLNRSNEPYHPPRPYKAVPHSRRDTDSLNDETFGSMECTSEDRAEAEKRRRASFETMRKEQQKILQEKQKLNLEKHKGSAIMDTCKDLADSKEEKELLERNNELEVSEGIPILSNDLDKSSFASHSPASRPLVPPGFKSNVIEKSSGSKSLVHPPLSQVGKSATVESLEDSNAHIIPSTNSSTGKCLSQELRVDGGLPAEKMHPALPLNKGENANLHVSLDVPTKKSGKEDQLFQTFYQDTHATLGDPFIAELDAGILEDKNASVSNKISSSSILEKILGSTLSLEDSQSNSVEHYKGKPKDTSGTWSPNSAKSSKFAQWFLEEEANATTDVSSSIPNDLLSLIVSGDKANGSSDQEPIKHKEEAVPVPAILTCEDLEQSILSEYSVKTTDVPPSVEEGPNPSDANGENPGTHVDNHASLHLLSMLKKSTDQSNTTANTIADINPAEKPLLSHEHDFAKMFNKHKGEENINSSAPNLGRTLTLETLFGSAFMKELQSVEAPVSVQRSSAGPWVDNPSEAHGLPFPTTDPHGAKTSRNENWLGFGNLPTGEIPSKGFDFQLPEENFYSVNSSSISSNATINIKEKLGMESTGSLPFPLFDSHQKMDPAIYRNMQLQQSSPRFQPTPQMPHARPLPYNHVNSSHLAYMGSQSKFLDSDPILNHGPLSNNTQTTPNIIRPSFQHPNVTVAGFDIPPQNPLMHQMQMPGNHTPHFPRGFPGPQHGNQGNGVFPDMNQAQGFPFGPHQQNADGCGMPISGNPPEAFQRLVEMELRANSKQTHPRASSHNPDMMRGYELDMGFRYR